MATLLLSSCGKSAKAPVMENQYGGEIFPVPSLQRQLQNIDELKALLANRKNAAPGLYILPPDVKSPIEGYNRILIDDEHFAYLCSYLSVESGKIQYWNCLDYTSMQPSLDFPSDINSNIELANYYGVRKRSSSCWLFTLEGNEIHDFNIQIRKISNPDPVFFVMFSSDKLCVDDIQMCATLDRKTGKTSLFPGLLYGNAYDLAFLDSNSLSIRDNPANIFTYSVVKNLHTAKEVSDLAALKEEGDAYDVSALMSGWSVYPHATVVLHDGRQYMILGRNWLPHDQPIHYDQRYMKIDYNLEKRLTALNAKSRTAHNGKLRLGNKDLLKELDVPIEISDAMNLTSLRNLDILLFSYDNSKFTTYKLTESTDYDKKGFHITGLLLERSIFYKRNGVVCIDHNFFRFVLHYGD
jgi:hypothetical protein